MFTNMISEWGGENSKCLNLCKCTFYSIERHWQMHHRFWHLNQWEVNFHYPKWPFKAWMAIATRYYYSTSTVVGPKRQVISKKSNSPTQSPKNWVQDHQSTHHLHPPLSICREGFVFSSSSETPKSQPVRRLLFQVRRIWDQKNGRKIVLPWLPSDLNRIASFNQSQDLVLGLLRPS